MDITIKGNLAVVTGTGKDVIAFGITFLKSLNPTRFLDDHDAFVGYVKQWQEGKGLFDISLKETKVAFVEALKDTL